MDGKTQARPLEVVRQRAYRLWQARGGAHGYDQEDWYLAEILLELEAELDRNLSPPTYRPVHPGEILHEVRVSHTGIDEFFSPRNSWIETVTSLETILEFDRNRKLHFDEGFLVASRRIARDITITLIADTDHFPYRDLPAMRQKIEYFASLYQKGVRLPPPLFFYPAPYQLEILDGVHRCLAALNVLNTYEPNSFCIWVGFDAKILLASQVVQQLWFSSLQYLYNSRHRRC